MTSHLMLILLLLCSGSVLAKPIDTKTTREIDHLFSFINTSSCNFNRNGTWYKAPAAGEHIKSKYEYLLAKGLINSTEEFIALAATKSSMSGKYYLVKCGDSAEISSARWLGSELTSYRSTQK